MLPPGPKNLGALFFRPYFAQAKKEPRHDCPGLGAWRTSLAEGGNAKSMTVVTVPMPVMAAEVRTAVVNGRAVIHRCRSHVDHGRGSVVHRSGRHIHGCGLHVDRRVIHG